MSKKIKAYENIINSTKIIKKCVNPLCRRKFIAYRGRKGGSRGIKIRTNPRPSNSKTCSKECSRIYNRLCIIKKLRRNR